MSGHAFELPTFDEEDDALFAEVAIRADVRSLVRGELSYGDIDLVEVARRLLSAGVDGIVKGKPSPVFLAFLAHAITRRLDGKVRSLDVAVGLRRKPGRKLKAPEADDPVVSAFHRVMSGAASGAEAPARGEVGFDELERSALDAAYEAKFGHSRARHKEIGYPAKSIDDRMMDVKRVLQSRDLYRLDARKGKRTKRST